MKKLLLSITIIIFSTFLFSCSKDDTASDSIDENGGQIYRYQVVTINVGSTSLTNNVYLGTLAGTTVELTKVADHELVFYVPETTPIGATELHINSLNNAKINYEVKDVILTQSVDETLAPLETNFENYGNQLSTASQDIPFVQNHSTMMSYYNGLSIEEKSEVAKFYKVNKTIIDAVYNTDYSTIQGRNIDMQENRALVLRFKAALAVGMIGSAVAVAEPSNIIRPIAIGVAIAGISAAVDYHFELIDRNINIIEMKINALTGTNNRNTNSQLSLTENVATTLPFNVNVRPIQETDSNSQQEYMKLYFATKNRLNELISNINEAILWVNNAIPFVSFDTLPLAQVSSSANPVTANVTSQIMQKINFSISHPNLSLETATLQSNGQLNLKVKFVGNPTATSISSTLNYTYNDDFSSFSGSFPLVVQQQDICTQNPMTPPVITGVNWECNANDEIAILISFTADGTGILAYGGTGACDLDGICYPVRLYFKSGDQPYAIAANGYRAFLRSGNLNSGVVEINFTSNGDCTASDGYQSFIQNWGPYNYQWKVEVMNQCNQRSNQVQL